MRQRDLAREWGTSRSLRIIYDIPMLSSRILQTPVFTALIVMGSSGIRFFNQFPSLGRVVG